MEERKLSHGLIAETGRSTKEGFSRETGSQR
jgi:hypothetical protein